VACAQSCTLWQQATIGITLLLLVRITYIWVLFYTPHTYGCSHLVRGKIAHSTQRQRRGCNNIPSFLQRTAQIARSFCEGCIWYDCHILVTTPFCCNRKAWAACAQSCTPWQQATIEITWWDHSIIACSRHKYMGIVVCAHPVRGESHIQRNANREAATLLLTTLHVHQSLL